MRSLILDVETTISNKGNPFDETNKLCYIGLLGSTPRTISIEYGDEPYRHKLEEVQKEIDNNEILVGFNIKFDLHWIRKYGINIMGKRVWDCQLVHFILTGQQYPYPSLNGVADYYDLGSKLDVVATEYWGNKIDTPNIPKDILEEYLIGDLQLTQKVYEKQMEDIQLGASRNNAEPENPERQGVVTYFNESKGYGFIADNKTKDNVFVHINQLSAPLKERDKVTFETERTQRGLSAIKVKKVG